MIELFVFVEAAIQSHLEPTSGFIRLMLARKNCFDQVLPCLKSICTFFLIGALDKLSLSE